MKMKLFYSFVALVLGGFLIVFGGVDDSPGGQALGVLFLILGVVKLFKIVKK